jgi:hypothetical protein
VRRPNTESGSNNEEEEEEEEEGKNIKLSL